MMSSTTQLEVNVATFEPCQSVGTDARCAASAVVESCCEAILDQLCSRCQEVVLKSVGISSISAAAGTSTVALNLAIAAARRTANRVIFVEANWLRPTLARTLSVPPAPGLSELIQGRADLPDCVRKTAMSGLHLLPLGDRLAAADETHGFPTVLAMLEDVYDLIVLDYPPIPEMNRQLTWLKQPSGIILVIETGQTGLEEVRDVGQQLQRAKVSIMGSVLNKC